MFHVEQFARFVSVAMCLLASPAWAADIRIPPAGDIQAVLDTAKPGDTLLLVCGATYAPFTVRQPVTVRADCELPTGRIDARQLPIIHSTQAGQPPITIANGTRNVVLIGLAVTQTGGQTYQLISIGAVGFTSLAEIPSDILIDRVSLYVAEDMTQRRGILCNGDGITVTRSRIVGIKERGADSQAIGCWNLPGRLTVADNWLEAAGEVIIIGGGDPSLPGLTPTVVLIEDNDITRPAGWQFLAQPWQVKNLLELKHARQVIIRRNRLWGNWAHAQDGFAVLITIQNQDGGCPWCVIEDVLMEHNRIWNTGQCWQISGGDAEGQPSGIMRRVVIRHNVCETLPAPEVGQCLTITGTPHAFTFERNTCINHGNALQIAGKVGAGSEEMIWRNNLMRHGAYGVVGGGAGGGTAALDAYWTPGYVFSGNVLAGGLEAGSHPVFYPPTTTMPSQADFERCFVSYQMPYVVRPDGPCAGQGASMEPLPARPTLLRLVPVN